MIKRCLILSFLLLGISKSGVSQTVVVYDYDDAGNMISRTPVAELAIVGDTPSHDVMLSESGSFANLFDGNQPLLVSLDFPMWYDNDDELIHNKWIDLKHLVLLYSDLALQISHELIESQNAS